MTREFDMKQREPGNKSKRAGENHKGRDVLGVDTRSIPVEDQAAGSQEHLLELLGGDSSDRSRDGQLLGEDHPGTELPAAAPTPRSRLCAAGEAATEAEEAGAPGPGPPPLRPDSCPPPPHVLPPGACQVVSCQADTQCLSHKRCCYNGCAYTCLEAVPPPPVLDWLVQPKPRWLGGNGWLLDGPEEVLPAEACSTTKDGAEPLHCPSGYKCHILSPGDMAKGIPNHGQCVRQRQEADGRSLQQKFHREYPEGVFKNVAEPGRGRQKRVQ
ncbi:PREDICTED: WAP four-disulfide core domain protein 1 [Chrysochloris asiatica]|uniref:WAP four-disulfide core domain protein 1 n=1 Tax=Chrysochloris asiatica TaxID=185453 RepID=A0A9B0TAR8_CHRAS|nr:PREDICTED: WAP four-disulfide core domain protein 1 [Chrysochloris asiatica]